MKLNTKRFAWVISRVRTIFWLWDNGLDWPDKSYCLRRIRDKESDLFYRIANEERADY